MRILRSLLVGLASFLCIFFITTAIWLSTIQITILNRAVGKSWLSTSGIYSHALDYLGQSPQVEGSSTISSGDVLAALKAAVPPSYTRQQIERVLDNFYDWLEGKAPRFTFSITLDDQREAFAQQLAAKLEPAIKALPVCSALQTYNNASCRPTNLTPEAFAKSLAQQTTSSSQFLNMPLSTDTIAQNALPDQQQLLAGLATLPIYRQWLSWLLVILPFAALLSAGVVLLVATDRLLASLRLCRHIFFSTIISLLGGLFLFYLGNNTQLIADAADAQSQATLKIILPLVQQVFVSIGQTLAFVSSGVMALALILWILLHIVRRRHSAASVTVTTTPPESPVENVQ